jgi:uroporphyrinogen III methyltransferase/synthase
VAELVDSGRAPTTPAAAIMEGTLPEQRVVVSDLESLPHEVASAGLGAPTVVVIGDVVSLRQTLGWWEDAPLFGMRALVTRAPHQARELASPLRAAGAIPVLVPLIDLRQNQDPAVLVEIQRAFASLSEYDDVLFSSTNSVRFFRQHAERLGLDASIRKLRARVLCIGLRTAREALDAGMPVHFVATGGRDAETMLREVRETLPPAGRRVLIPRSDIGRDVLVQGLRESGAEVDAIPFYCNRPPSVDGDRLRADLVAGRLPILTFTSPSTVEHFVALLDAPARAACARSIIGAIGNTTGRALREAGLEPDVVPERPGVRDMVAAIAAHVAAMRREIAGQEDET